MNDLRIVRLVLGRGNIAVLLTVSILGCAGADKASVSGTVKRKDGSPLVGAQLLARSKDTGKSARGETDAQGHYVLNSPDGTNGFPPGDYGIIVAEDLGSIANPRKPSIDGKYANASTSGLAFSVKPGEKLVFDITLDPP